MLKIYFDDVLIDEDSYTALSNDYKLFTDSFKLGSVACNSFKLSVNKEMVSTQPNDVRIEDDNSIFHLVVDSVTEDRYVYNYTLTDKLINFNFDYDASFLINEKAENGEDCYLSDIWKDMCVKANVEYDETYVFENDIVVTWYDSRVQARKYLSYIAELQSGYACILENGKQTFKKQNRPSVKTIDADECSDLIVGEKKKITRVVFDGGAFKYEFGDETGDTLYLQNDNVFIVNEQIVENIYNNIKDFEFYILDVPQAPMDSTIKAGDIITFTNGNNEYPTIAQYSMSYVGGWTGGYQLKVNTTKQQETQVTRAVENVKNLKVDVDRLNNEFSIVVEEVNENSSKVSTMEQTVDGFTDAVVKVDNIAEEISELKQTSNELSLVFKENTKNPNLMSNSSGFFGTEGLNNAFYKFMAEIIVDDYESFDPNYDGGLDNWFYRYNSYIKWLYVRTASSLEGTMWYWDKIFGMQPEFEWIKVDLGVDENGNIYFDGKG